MNDLAIRSIRRFLVRVPVRTPIVWGSGCWRRPEIDHVMRVMPAEY